MTEEQSKMLVELVLVNQARLQELNETVLLVARSVAELREDSDGANKLTIQIDAAQALAERASVAEKAFRESFGLPPK